MKCSITGRVAIVPVVSKISGHLFEKELIEKHIRDDGKCPITGNSLTMDDIIVIRKVLYSTSNGKSSSNFAAPALNGSSSSNTKSSSYSAAPVLTGSSSSNTKSSSYPAAPALNGSSSTAVDGSACPQFPRSISKEIKVTRRKSSGMRRHRRIEIATSADALRGYIFNKGYTLHKTIMPGVLSMDIDNSKSIIATGGADTNAVVFDLSGKTVSTLSGHSEKVTSVKFVNEGELVVTGSCDKTVRLWQKSEKGSYKCKNTLDHHTAEVRAVTIHPSQKYFVTASDDCSWQFYDLASASHITRGVGKGSESFSTAVFHPDGRILGTSALNLVRFWDVAKQNDILKIDAHTGRTVTSIAFSENGYTLATAAGDGVKLWDIRFLRTMHTLPSDDICSQTRSVEFDHSGMYLATGGGACISIYDIAAKPYPITTFSHMSGKGDLSCVKFGKNAEYVAAARTLDSKLLLFGPSEGNNSYNC